MTAWMRSATRWRGIAAIVLAGGVVAGAAWLGSRDAGPLADSSDPTGEAARGGDHPAALEPTAPVEPRVSAAVEPCAMCHEDVVAQYLRHGMARTIGRPGPITPGTVENPVSKVRYDLTTDAEGGLLTATYPDGGVRRQRIVGRIGAGIFDTSWVGAEMDVVTGRVTDRLFFAPVETVTGRGLELSPFELHAPSAGLDLALTRECLTCHTLTEPEDLPGAAVPVGAPAGERRAPFPDNHLGADAFSHLSAFACSTCHGAVDRHPGIVMGQVDAVEGDLGLTRLGTLPPGEQRDICARCHLQGEARFDLVDGRVRRDLPLGGQIPVVVATQVSTDFRFVGQVDRLALSACFRGSPAMTCTTCHAPHASVAEQGTASFDAACATCHQVGQGHTKLTVREVTGHDARTPTGCVDCHVRRSQPFDLPHVRTVDHYVRRHIEPPTDDVPHRQFADPSGPVAIHDDGRLGPALETPEGRRWAAGVLGMALVAMGRFDEAAQRLSAFPAPGTPAARTPFAPSGFAPLEARASFHYLRGMLLMSRGALAEADAALTDAIEVDPLAPHPRMLRARLGFQLGDDRRALVETQGVLSSYPHSEQPWDLRVEIAARVGRADLAVSALDASARIWPSNPDTWIQIGRLVEATNAERAREAYARALALRPSIARR